jgi:hypothetical protein
MDVFMNGIQTVVQSVAGYLYTGGEALVTGTQTVLTTAGDGIIAVGRAIFLGIGIGG